MIANNETIGSEQYDFRFCQCPLLRFDFGFCHPTGHMGHWDQQANIVHTVLQPQLSSFHACACSLQNISENMAHVQLPLPPP